MNKECPYCEPDGTYYHGDNSIICPFCKGTHEIPESDIEKLFSFLGLNNDEDYFIFRCRSVTKRQLKEIIFKN